MTDDIQHATVHSIGTKTTSPSKCVVDVRLFIQYIKMGVYGGGCVQFSSLGIFRRLRDTGVYRLTAGLGLLLIRCMGVYTQLENLIDDAIASFSLNVT